MMHLRYGFSFYKEMECSSAGIRYRIRFVMPDPLGPGQAPLKKMLIERSTDEGDSWVAMSLRLDVVSRIKILTAAVPYWPPEVLTDFGCNDGALWFEYVDAPDEQQWGRKHALWRAIYQQQRDVWKITRLDDVSFDVPT